VLDCRPLIESGGGRIIAAGTPEQVARTESSYTGQFLRKIL
jgi:excinuclease ABC subunit A